MKLPDAMREMLNESGLPWRIEAGSRHFKVILNDRLATILPKGKSLRRESKKQLNALAHLRRAIKRERR